MRMIPSTFGTLFADALIRTHSVSFSLLATACSEPRGGNVDAAATGRKLIM